jgi:hypothetical protein
MQLVTLQNDGEQFIRAVEEINMEIDVKGLIRDMEVILTEIEVGKLMGDLDSCINWEAYDNGKACLDLEF